jgi:hypothetical protein
MVRVFTNKLSPAFRFVKTRTEASNMYTDAIIILTMQSIFILSKYSMGAF